MVFAQTVEAVGLVLVVVGLALAWPPLGLIAVGVLLVALAALIEQDTHRAARDAAGPTRPQERTW